MIPDNLAKRSFKAALKRAGLPAMRFHDLRHTAATLLLGHGVHPKVVSEMLGHADISITLRVYAHVLPHMQQAAVALMETLFGAPSSEPESVASEHDEQAAEIGRFGVNCRQNCRQTGKRKALDPEQVRVERGGDGGESNSPSKLVTETICYRFSRLFDHALMTPTDGVHWRIPTVSR